MGSSRPLHHIASLDGLAFGRLINNPAQAVLNSSKHISNGNSQTWRFQPGTYTPKQVVEQVAPLLNSLVAQLGRDRPGAVPSRKVLIDGLQECLATVGRSSTLPLGHVSQLSGDSARKEIAGQAEKIGSLLVRYAQEVSSSDGVNSRMVIRSPCEGHVWSRDSANLLVGSRSNGNLMQVYNEWLHQLVLLRDGLLPFENFDEVRLNIKPDSAPGTRPLEDIRPKFMTQIMTAGVKRETIIDVAKILTASSLPSRGYGFQYASGMVMPVSLLTGNSSVLLRYIPATVDDSEQQELLFDYQDKDYFSIPRTEIKPPLETIPSTSSSPFAGKSSIISKLTSSSLAIEKPSTAKASSQIRNIKLLGAFDDGKNFSVDLGQVARGLRYAHRVSSSNTKTDNSASPRLSSVGLHKASDILALPNMVTSTGTADDIRLHAIQADSPIVRLALLGKLYPENVVLLDGEQGALSRALGVGKGFGPQFAIVGGGEAAKEV
ncbi:MAG: hypothetical protein LQ352_005063 [Teloschistes flavicans]|nr:MAG: hypothetical protein LQ352_005063 [Teloschistes flavicans]